MRVPTIPQAGDKRCDGGSDTDGPKIVYWITLMMRTPAILMFADCMGFAMKTERTIISPRKGSVYARARARAHKGFQTYRLR